MTQVTEAVKGTPNSQPKPRATAFPRSRPVSPFSGHPADAVSLMRYTTRHDTGWHYHDFYELVLISKGSCIHRFRDESRVLIPGDCFLIPLHEPHNYSISAETEIINCLFYPHALGRQWDALRQLPGIGQLLDPGRQWHPVHLAPDRLIYARQMLGQLEAYCAVAGTQNLAAAEKATPLAQPAAVTGRADLICQNCLALLLLEVAGLAESDGQAAIRGSDQGRQIVGRLLAFMENHYAQPVTSRQLAEHVHLSEGYCRRLFVQYTGYPPVEFLNRLRIQHASLLLQAGGCTVAEVANQVGFADAGYFARLFRKQLRAKPRDFLPQAAICPPPGLPV